MEKTVSRNIAKEQVASAKNLGRLIGSYDVHGETANVIIAKEMTNKFCIRGFVSIIEFYRQFDQISQKAAPP